MMIDHLTERGIMDPRLLYAAPFTDIDPLGVAGVFGESEVVQLIQSLQEVQGSAAASTPGCASKLAEASVEAKAKQAAGLRFIRQTRFKDDAIPIDCFG